MTTARVLTIAPEGLTGRLVTVEVAARPGLSSLKIVGLPGRTVAEAKERVRVALRNNGVKLPSTNIVVNLAPAEVVKTGTHYDLPIALGLLAAAGRLPNRTLDRLIVAGELGLDGSLRTFRQTAAIARAAAALHCPLLTAAAARRMLGDIRGLRAAWAENLTDLLCLLNQPRLSVRAITPSLPPAGPVDIILLEDIAGLEQPKRALLLAAAGKHHLLLCGSPGTGKSMLAGAAGGLLPSIEPNDRALLTALHDRPTASPPFRSPHHSASPTMLVGGGTLHLPGEISLAHAGILFLDELPRFSRPSLLSLLEPLESAQIELGGARPVVYPADCIVIGAYNPCPCGYLGDEKIPCRCRPGQLELYRAKLSGPLLDRFSLFAPCRPANETTTLTTAAAKAAVIHARSRQRARGQSAANGRLPSSVVRRFLDRRDLAPLVAGLQRAGRSWRSIIHAGQVARTIADLDNRKEILPIDLQEAIGWLPPLANPL